MAKQVLNNLETRLSFRTKLNDNFTELYTAKDAAVTLTGSQTITGTKTFYSSGIKINNPANTFAYTLVGGAIVADRNITLPVLTGNDEFTFNAATQTLDNKTFGVGGFNLFNLAGTFRFNFIGTAIAADRTITIPAVSTNTQMMLLTALGSNGGIPTQAGGNRFAFDSTFAYTSGVLTATNVQISDDLRITEGSNKSCGAATLVGGTVTVNTTAVNTASRIFINHATIGGTPGHLTYTIINATSFTVTSSSGTDTSTINWLIIN
jgi:hypothetical protein